MGLISLTFGTGKQNLSVQAMRDILYPKDAIQCQPGQENRLEIIKVCTFYNSPDVYVVGKVMSGLVKEDMHCHFNGRKVFISDLDSKLKGIAKQGMTVGFNVEGISPKELSKGDVLEFKLD
ncbi:MAG: hypothetical protein JW772_05705 [Candidatus Diapherotrites archaeon]|nr:hypothetical protein [Candidatus Diapherotrites archaeon]